ncbi:acyl CoA binding protein-domain-containing protein [Gongronella butleri]|nr:acyl CoA binding protein-domain-containing protein [Gongronella butleri]
MTSVPSHYSERYINQRYNKALGIVQNLPPSSSFQPTKDQKLELYSLYKQVSQGNVDTPRPGIFDVVGRAKWDAWKKLEGMTVAEAKHRYVETLLAVCAEAYRKPQAKAQVQAIVQAFATIRPEDDDDETDEQDSEDTTDQDVSGKPKTLNGMYDWTLTRKSDSDESVDAEEKAYLRDIQNSVPQLTPSRSMTSRTSNRSRQQQQQQYQRRSWHEKQGLPPQQAPGRAMPRAPSVESTPSMMTALSSPFTRRSSQQQQRRPPSSASQQDERPRQPFVDESIVSNTVNPWATTSAAAHLLPPTRHAPPPSQPLSQQPQLPHASHHHHHHHPRYDSSDDDRSTSTRTMHQHQHQQPYRPYAPSASSRRPSSSSASQAPPRIMRATPQESPMMESATSSVTATGPAPERRYLTEQQYSSVVSLGPATKRALETLQSEIIALNDRIDGLRQELLTQQRRNKPMLPDADDFYGWRWVIKAALKHASLNILTLFILFVILYQRKSPIAIAIANAMFKKQWKLGLS